MKLYYHTREPYSVDGSEVAPPAYTIINIEGTRHDYIGETRDQKVAMEIVKRANNHERLIHALQDVLGCIEMQSPSALANSTRAARGLLKEVENT